MNVLVACEESQRVCIAFRERGHNAFSCDVQNPSGGHLEWHIKQDVMSVLNPESRLISFRTMNGNEHTIIGKWDLIIAHPPCTYLSNAGARHLYKGHVLNEERFAMGLKAKEFFMRFYNADCERICIENPVPSKCYGLPEYAQIIQPYMFGHPYTKRTCLWLKGIAPLIPTKIVKPIATWCPSGSYSHNHGEQHRGMFTNDRAKNRSKTFEGIAAAMAAQWGREKEYETD